jgi:hypothetical protein
MFFFFIQLSGSQHFFQAAQLPPSATAFTPGE